jgi:localization factor PodJL
VFFTVILNIRLPDRIPGPLRRLFASNGSKQGHILFLMRHVRMKSGGPWNLRGLRPEARAAARAAARASGLSVGEWLNNVIQPVDEPEDEARWAEDFDRESNDRPTPGPRDEDRATTRYRDAPLRGARDLSREDEDRRSFRDDDREHRRYRDVPPMPQPDHESAVEPQRQSRDDVREQGRRHGPRPERRRDRERDGARRQSFREDGREQGSYREKPPQRQRDSEPKMGPRQRFRNDDRKHPGYRAASPQYHRERESESAEERQQTFRDDGREPHRHRNLRRERNWDRDPEGERQQRFRDDPPEQGRRGDSSPRRNRERELESERWQSLRDDTTEQSRYREEPQVRYREQELEGESRQGFRDDAQVHGNQRDRLPYPTDRAPDDQLDLDFRKDDWERRTPVVNARGSDSDSIEQRPVRHDGRPDHEQRAPADARRAEPERNDRPPAGWDRFDRVTVSAAERDRVERAALNTAERDRVERAALNVAERDRVQQAALRAAARDRFERVAANIAERNRQEQAAANLAQRKRQEALAPSAAVDEIRDASIDKAVAEITARQRVLDSEAVAAPSRSAPPQPAAAPQGPERLIAAWTESELAQKVGEGSVDIRGLEQQLRQLTVRIEALRPSAELEKAVNGLRNDLAEIGRSLTEALPRRALEDLELEVKTLGQRVDQSRQSGADLTALASIEHGLAEVREALRGLTPAESLVGFDVAVQGLTKKIDEIASKEDSAALQQLETAIGALRGMVSRVASNDTLTKVADDVRTLSAKVDSLAASETPKLSALENRIDILAAALNASAEAGQAVPRELEKLLSGLVEKLEWVQLSHTDHTALAHLEDRIATLVKRLDASDARLGLLEGVERGLADLLVYIEQLRGPDGAAAGAKTFVAKTSVAETSAAKTSAAKTSVEPPVAAAIEQHEVPEIGQTERHGLGSLDDMHEGLHGTVERVERLATIGSEMWIDRALAASAELLLPALDAPEVAPHPVTASVFEATPMPAGAAPMPVAPAASHVTPKLSKFELPQLASSTSRTAIDPSLPPDHPLEPGSISGRSRQSPSAADRIAASEAAIGPKPPVISDLGGGKPDFIAAARRAAKAAAASTDNRKISRIGATSATQPKKLTDRLRTLAVAAAGVVIVVGGFPMVSRLFEDGSGAPTPAQAPPAETSPQGQTEAPRPQSEPPSALPDQRPPQKEPPHVEAEPLAAPGATESSANAPATIPGPPLDLGAAPQPGAPGAAASAPADITGSLPGSHSAAPTSPAGNDKLPLAIGGPALRLAALAGDPSAAYEVAIRFAEGRLVPANNEEAARWFEIAAKKGLAPAEFRLGAVYEKGLGVKKNLVTARGFYRAAAEKGHGKAMHNLAVLYAEGAEGNPDYRTAAQWFRKAADRGIADSQYNLAILYARGVGVEQNLGESYKWFFLAAKEGDQDAARKRDEIASRLDQPSLEAARAAADKWTPLPQPADAITVKGVWDAPANGTPPPKPKPHSANLHAERRQGQLNRINLALN